MSKHYTKIISNLRKQVFEKNICSFYLNSLKIDTNDKIKIYKEINYLLDTKIKEYQNENTTYTVMNTALFCIGAVMTQCLYAHGELCIPLFYLNQITIASLDKYTDINIDKLQKQQKIMFNFLNKEEQQIIFEQDK